jgi:hypothetical protein
MLTGPCWRPIGRAWAGSADWTVEVWWIYVVVVLLFAFGIYAFISIVGFRTHQVTRRTTRTAADMYDSYADSPRKQRRYARERGGEWRDEDQVGPPGGSGQD